MTKLALELSLPAVAAWKGGGVALSGAATLLGAETSGLAFAASDDTMEIRDTVTPANNYTGTPGAKLTTTRGSVGYYFNSSGVIASAAVNTLRRDYDPRIPGGVPGYLIEFARTNIVLWNRDLTNAAWVKTNCTAAKTQTGIDAVANSASSLTATSAAATCLQTITSGAGDRWHSCYIKRLTGSGTIEMTMDNVTWTTVTVTSSWVGVDIPKQLALVNPVVGFRIATSGDSIAVDCVQNEAVSSVTTGRSSPMFTTTASATRGADLIGIPTTAFNWQTATTSLYAKYCTVSAIATHTLFAQDVRQLEVFLTGYRPDIYSQPAGATLSAVSTPAAGTINKSAAAIALNDTAFSSNGAAVLTDLASTAMLAVATLRLGTSFNGSSNYLHGWILEGMHLPRRMSNAELITRTT